MIVLDTHVWIWWVSDPGLVSADARKLMQRSIKYLLRWDILLPITRK